MTASHSGARGPHELDDALAVRMRPSAAVDSQSARTTCWLCATTRVLRVVGRRRKRKDAAVVDLVARSSPRTCSRERVVADRSGQPHFGIERAQVVRNVAGAAERERVIA